MMYLEQQILEWAEPKGLLNPKNVLTQFAKTVSEVGELGDALIKNDLDAVCDAVGDILVTLVILANQKGLTMEQCVSSAYNKIKNRKGKTLANGNFVKEENLATKIRNIDLENMAKVRDSKLKNETIKTINNGIVYIELDSASYVGSLVYNKDIIKRETYDKGFKDAMLKYRK